MPQSPAQTPTSGDAASESEFLALSRLTGLADLLSTSPPDIWPEFALCRMGSVLNELLESWTFSGR